MYRMLAAVMLIVVVTACADGAGPGDEAGDTGAAPAVTPTGEPARPEAVAVADLAAHAGVEGAEIEVVAREDVTWRDGSMGCPEPGESYTQALVEGYRLVLRAAGVEYFYHGATGQPPLRCDDPDPDATIGTGAEGAGAGGDVGPPAGPAKEDDMSDRDGPLAEAIADLAGRTGADPDAIEVVMHEEVTWPDGSMGCPRPGMMYTQALVDGYRIVLRVNGDLVSYHGANGHPPFRCDTPGRGGAVSDPRNR